MWSNMALSLRCSIGYGLPKFSPLLLDFEKLFIVSPSPCSVLLCPELAAPRLIFFSVSKQSSVIPGVGYTGNNLRECAPSQSEKGGSYTLRKTRSNNDFSSMSAQVSENGKETVIFKTVEEDNIVEDDEDDGCEEVWLSHFKELTRLDFLESVNVAV